LFRSKRGVWGTAPAFGESPSTIHQEKIRKTPISSKGRKKGKESWRRHGESGSIPSSRQKNEKSARAQWNPKEKGEAVFKGGGEEESNRKPMTLKDD